MRIDRARFLACVSSLAAAGCPEPAAGQPAVAPMVSAPAADASAHGIARADGAAPAPVSAAAPTCGPTAGASSDCALLRPPGPSCESFDYVKASCEHLGRHLRPAAAKAVAACLVARTGTEEICMQLRRPGPLSDCVMAMIDDVCLDPSVDAACQKVVATLPREAIQHWGGTPHSLRECQEVASAARELAPAMACLASPAPEECLGALVFDVDP